ncbi:MAG: class I SAM-dependent rRNA methyltransferase, partial [Muribaculaceae bacterium]|nr:class I SAM-dependent rRNA methyltransferase [Muribaculaceae bacterium]
MMKEIKLKKGKEESLGRFHPWIFSGAIAVAPADGIEEGEVVRVVGHDGRVLGLGDWQIGSIAVRMLHFG